MPDLPNALGKLAVSQHLVHFGAGLDASDQSVQRSSLKVGRDREYQCVRKRVDVEAGQQAVVAEVSGQLAQCAVTADKAHRAHAALRG